MPAPWPSAALPTRTADRSSQLPTHLTARPERLTAALKGRPDDDVLSVHCQARHLQRRAEAEQYTAAETGIVNSIYYFEDKKAVAQLTRFPQHREAKGRVQRWYDGYRIVVSEVRAMYGGGRLVDEPTLGDAPLTERDHDSTDR